MSTKYDVIVIGSGPGGYVAAIRASATYRARRKRRLLNARSKSVTSGNKRKVVGMTVDGRDSWPESVSEMV